MSEITSQYFVKTSFSNRLTNQAQEFAQFLATRNSGIQHCSETPGCDTHGAGENLSTGKNATKGW